MNDDQVDRTQASGYKARDATRAKPGILRVLVFAFLVLAGRDLPGHAAQPGEASQLRQARSLIEGQRWDEAEAQLRAYLTGNPKSEEAQSMLGTVLFQRDQPEESIQAFQAVAVHRKLKASELKTLALDYATVGKMEAARRTLAESVAIDGGDQGAWEALGHVQVEMGRYEEAIKSFHRVLVLAPKTAFAATEIGLASERIARFEDAAKAFTEAIEWQAGEAAPDPMPFIALGKVLIAQNKPEQALGTLRRALAFDGDDSRVHEQLGRAYLALNDLDAARTELEKAVRLDGSVAGNHLALSQVYRKLGRKQDAAAQVEAYTALSAAKAAPSSPAEAAPGAGGPEQ